MFKDQRYQEKLKQLVAVLPESTQTNALAAVSDELEELLWLYAEDDITDMEEERLWELASQEPGALSRFRGILASIAKSDPVELSSLPERVLEQLRASSPDAITASPKAELTKIVQQATEFGKFIADISIEVAQEFLRLASGQHMQLSLSSARSGSSEPRTTFQKQLLRRIGILVITIDHAGNGKCNLTVRITEPGPSYPVPSLQVRLISESGVKHDPELFSGDSVRLANLDVNNYFLVFEQHGREVDRLGITLEAFRDK